MSDKTKELASVQYSRDEYGGNFAEGRVVNTLGDVGENDEKDNNF